MKRKEAITVVIGNPPYKEKAKGRGGWVEDRGDTFPAPLNDWQPPAEWGLGAHAKHLRNLYIYFWRWAAWKVFGGEPFRSGTDLQEVKWTERRGIICFITVAGFLNGPGFQKMRADLRRDADEIFVIDCSPEGHQAPVANRIFQGVQQPVCIVLALRRSAKGDEQPATVRFVALSEGSRKLKFDQLAALTLDSEDWAAAPKDWRMPFLPAGAAEWVGFPALDDLFTYNGTGVMAGRTWVIAPDGASLSRRWKKLRDEKNVETKELLFHPHEGGDRSLKKVLRDSLPGIDHPLSSVATDESDGTTPVRYAFRSFDRQWILPDNRLINRPNPKLWESRSGQQVYLTALMAHSPSSGIAISIAGSVPDIHHYKGSFGGRVFPLWVDAAATEPNMPTALITELSASFGRPVTGPDIFAYIAAVAASPAYTERFHAHLKQPGLRIPLTAERALFDEAVSLGREVVWLHTFGERFAEGQPPGMPRVAKNGPTIPSGGTLPDAWADVPHDLEYDAAERRLKIGKGFIANVSPEVWEYEVSGKNVVRQWWSYRRKDRSKPQMGDKRLPSKLTETIPPAWLAEYTTELLALLHVLTRLIILEPRQADVLDRIVCGALIDSDALRAVGSLGDASAEMPEVIEGDEE